MVLVGEVVLDEEVVLVGDAMLVGEAVPVVMLIGRHALVQVVVVRGLAVEGEVRVELVRFLWLPAPWR